MYKLICLLSVLASIFLFKVQALAAVSCGRDKSPETCLLCVCWHESRGEEYDGKVAVLKTVLSRVESDEFPNTVCGVIYQPSQFTGISRRKSIKTKNPTDEEALNDCRKAVDVAEAEGANGILYFHTPGVKPGWSSKFKRCGQVDDHIFYTSGERCPAKLGATGAINRRERPVPKSSRGVN